MSSSRLERKILSPGEALGQAGGANFVIAVGMIWTVRHVAEGGSPVGDSRFLKLTHNSFPDLKNARFDLFWHEDIARAELPDFLQSVLYGAKVGAVPKLGDEVQTVGFHQGNQYRFMNKVIAVGNTRGFPTNNAFIVELTTEPGQYQVGMSSSVAVNGNGEVVGLLSREFDREKLTQRFGLEFGDLYEAGDGQKALFFALEPYVSS